MLHDVIKGLSFHTLSSTMSSQQLSKHEVHVSHLFSRPSAHMHDALALLWLSSLSAVDFMPQAAAVDADDATADGAPGGAGDGIPAGSHTAAGEILKRNPAQAAASTIVVRIV